MTRSSCSGPFSPTPITSCAVLQHFIARQMPIPLCPARIGGATSMCAPRPNPQPPQISEGETNQNSSDGGTSLSAHWPRSDQPQTTVNNLNGSKRPAQQHFSPRSVAVPTTGRFGRSSSHPQQLSCLLRECRGRTGGWVVVGVLRRWRISANSASARPQGCELSHTRIRRSVRRHLGEHTSVTDHDEKIAAFDLRSRGDRDSGDGARRRRRDGCFHLHRLDSRN